MEKQITYTLETPIEYAHKGELQESTFITLDAPTSRNMNECATLKQAFYRSLPKGGEVDADSDTSSGELSGDTIMTIITMSQDVELSAVLVTGRELLTSGIAKLGGEEKVTKPILDKISMDDLSGMIGEYMANFILASALRGLKKS